MGYQLGLVSPLAPPPQPLITVQARWTTRPSIRRSRGSYSPPRPSLLPRNSTSIPFRGTTPSRPSPSSPPLLATHRPPTPIPPSPPPRPPSPVTPYPPHPTFPGPATAHHPRATTYPHPPAASPNPLHIDQNEKWPATLRRTVSSPPPMSSMKRRTVCHLRPTLSRSSTSAYLPFSYSALA